MKKTLLFLSLMGFFFAKAQMTDSLTLRSISNEIMNHGECYEDLRFLTKKIGHRLSGSDAAAKAVSWAKKTLEEAGADSVWLQPVLVPHWVRGKENLKIAFKGKEFEEVPLLSLGGSIGTDGKIIEANVLRVPDMAAFNLLSEAQVKGKIVFFDYRFRQDIINTFDGYSDAVYYRWASVSAASKKKAIAVIIRSIGTNENDEPHTGSTHYDEGVHTIPAIAIGNISADRLAKACENNHPRTQLLTSSRFLEPVLSYNVIGEIRGQENPEEVMVVGGHLDSWDIGEGAHDDGAGIVQSIEILRTFKKLAIPLKRTLRVVCFMNEENGMKGGLAYADSTRNEKHIFAIESDAGGFTPRGVGLIMDEHLIKLVHSWKSLFIPYEIYDFNKEWDGVDISPLKKRGVPVAGLVPDSQRYFDVHHSANDVFEAVNSRELKLGAFTMGAMLFLVDKYF